MSAHAQSRSSDASRSTSTPNGANVTLAEEVTVAQAVEYVALAKRLLEVAVVKARREGQTWKMIGADLGISHQGARSTWSPIVAKGLASTNGHAASSGNGVQGSSDHVGSVDGDPAFGKRNNGDSISSDSR